MHDVLALGGTGVPWVPDGALNGTGLYGALAVLALLDSTSFGTLLIPVWLLLAPGRLRVGRILLYLATIFAFYAGVGLLISFGVLRFGSVIAVVAEQSAVRWLQLALGVALVVVSYKIDPGGSRRRERAEASATEGPAGSEARQPAGRLARLRARAMGVTERGGGNAASTSVSVERRSAFAPMMALALTAAVLEVATMLPYLAGIGLISASGASWRGSIALICGYCVVMVLPALVLVAARLIAHRQVEPLLNRVNSWLSRHGASSTAWVVGIVGVLIAINAAEELNVFGFAGR